MQGSHDTSPLATLIAQLEYLEIRLLHDRLRCAQSLRAGCLPETGALNNMRPDTQEARYAAFN